MEKQIVKNLYGIVNARLASEVYCSVVYVLSELEKHFKVYITDNYITDILTDAIYYEYVDDANLLELYDKVIQ